MFKTCVTGIVLVGVMNLFMHYLVFNPSISLQPGYYFSYPALQYKVGDIVLLCVDKLNYVKTMHLLGLPYVNHACNYRTPHLIKRIIATHGDVVIITQRGIMVNGHLLANSRQLQEFHHINLQPQPLGQVVLAQDEYFVLGKTEHSYDSRYFGVIKKAQIYRRAWFMFR